MTEAFAPCCREDGIRKHIFGSAVEASLYELTKEYVATTQEGHWLNDIRWSIVPVIMKELPKDVCGKYSFGKIYLMPCAEATAIFPTYIHELRHCWQWKTKPIFYVVGKIIRPLIEDDAVCQEEAASNWIQARRQA